MPQQASCEVSSAGWSWQHIALLGLAAAYLNALTYGFVYGTENHHFELALVNWLRDPSLYPHDPIRDAFVRLPTFFWATVAYLSKWMSTKQVVFLFFALTKAIFFVALVRLVAGAVRDLRAVAAIVLVVALSPLLNENNTPFGASGVLDPIQTNSSLAVALLLVVGLLLLQGHWIRAAVLCALTAYVNALFVNYTLLAFAAFAVLDWPLRRRQIALAALLGAAISLPWLSLWPDALPREFPRHYHQALLMFYPLHHTLCSHSAFDLVCGAGLVVGAVCMVAVAKRIGLGRYHRLEVLAAAYLFPVLLGAMFGEFFPDPRLDRVQLLRADSFLVLYALLLIQIYGANLLLASPIKQPTTAKFLGISALLLPLTYGPVLLPLLFLALLFWADPKERFERLCRRLAPSCPNHHLGARSLRLGAALCGLAPLISIIFIPRVSGLWNLEAAPDPLEADSREVQQWAKANTPREAQFLVPTDLGGFRAFSERSSWGEWKDGTAVYLFPPFAELYVQRMEALGLRWESKWIDFDAMQANYKRLSWQHLLAIARENHLNYIVQFRDVPYQASPIFANHSYAVYLAPPDARAGRVIPSPKRRPAAPPRKRHNVRVDVRVDRMSKANVRARDVEDQRVANQQDLN